VEDFESFPSPAQDVTSTPPGTWATYGTISGVDTGAGANFEVRSGNYLHTYVNTGASAITTYANLGRAIRRTGMELTEADAFSLTIDLLAETGDHTWNSLMVGLQDADGSDDGSRAGLAIGLMDAGWTPYAGNVAYAVDMASFAQDQWGYNFTSCSAWSSQQMPGTYDQLRLTYDNSFVGYNVLVEMLNSGSTVQSVTWTYSGSFSFENVVVVQGTGTANSGSQTMDLDNITVVPEPATLMLLAGGFGSVLLRRRS